MLIIFPTLKTIISLFLTAIFFPIALPPTIILEIIDDTTNAEIVGLTFNLLAIKIAIIAPILPETIPHISPIISLQKLAILLEFLINLILSLEPLILLDAFAWKVDSSAVNTAVPIISKIIPIKTITIVIINKIII